MCLYTVLLMPSKVHQNILWTSYIGTSSCLYKVLLFMFFTMITYHLICLFVNEINLRLNLRCVRAWVLDKVCLKSVHFYWCAYIYAIFQKQPYKFWCTQTVNQLLFAMTVFRNLPEINWLPVTNFYDQDEDYLEKNVPKTFKYWSSARNICDDEALIANLWKIYCPRK